VLGPLDIPRLSEAGLSLPVLIFPAPLTLAVALVRSLVPIVSADKVNLMTLLKESSTGSGAGRIGHASRGGLVIAEIAVAVILLFTSGILLRSLWAAENLNPGFEFVDRWHSVVERPAPGRQDVPVTMVNMADSAYFRTMRIPLVAGRALSGKDKAGGPTVAVINEELVRAWWKDPRSAIGQHIKLGGPCMRLWCK
jgi:putative ABC transport system permease protein